METDKDDVILFEQEYRQTSFLRRKINLTVPVCLLLIAIFLASAFVVSLCAFYLTEGAVCYIINDENTPAAEPVPKPVYYSRPKRSPTSGKKDLPWGIESCKTALSSNVPWNQSRLPTNVYPIDYILTLDLFKLNDENDQYSGTVDIVLDVLSPTYDIILHSDVLVSDVLVSRRGATSIPVTVDCLVPSLDAQTLTIHLTEEMQVGEVYDVTIAFFRALSVHGTGLFENEFSKDQYGNEKSRMIVSHFEPVHAREAYPCFDEPGFKAKFQLAVNHENNTKILSNWDESGSFWDEAWLTTEFETTPPVPTALTGFAMFYTDDFDQKTVQVPNPITGEALRINLWARKLFFTNDDGIYIDASLDMLRRIFAAFLDIFQEVKTHVVPKQIDILAVPEYPSDAISHWGFVIFAERALLHNPSTTSEVEHQRIALLVAKELAEQWYGNFVSFRWWSDLWLQEAIANYLKYHAVHAAYPAWNIHDQFTVGELLPTLYDDAMSTSHPISKTLNSATEIDELFDSIETTKATAILQMADHYMQKTLNVQNNTLLVAVSFLRDNEYGFLNPDEILSQYGIFTWTGQNFFDRWLLQSNYPKISARFVKNTTTNEFTFQLQQSRFLSAHMYDNDLYPPSTNSFGYVWYIPMTCYFSNDSSNFSYSRTFFIQSSILNAPFGSLYFEYFYCNTDFAGYYIMDYSTANWQALSTALDNNNTQLTELDRANLINNAFLQSQAVEKSYSIVREVTQFLLRNPYTGLPSWQTLSYHVNRMLDVLEYESLYTIVQRYFRVVVRNYYQTYATALWNTEGTFPEQVLKSIIIQFACRMQLPECIDTATAQWTQGYLALVSGFANHSVPSHAREVVYRTHFQNTYNDSEWIAIEGDYHTFVDVQERYRLLEALTQSRQPWHLYQLLYRDAEGNIDRDVDLLEVLTLLARNPTGREMVWTYYRKNWSQLQTIYGRTNQRLGQLLIDITATFEDEFHELELVSFLASTPGVNANVDARFWALERANMNFWWITDSSVDLANSLNLDP